MRRALTFCNRNLYNIKKVTDAHLSQALQAHYDKFLGTRCTYNSSLQCPSLGYPNQNMHVSGSFVHITCNGTCLYNHKKHDCMDKKYLQSFSRNKLCLPVLFLFFPVSLQQARHGKQFLQHFPLSTLNKTYTTKNFNLKETTILSVLSYISDQINAYGSI